jgi:uncharacterized surface protein with fasciclin (FAS1) repeats
MGALTGWGLVLLFFCSVSFPSTSIAENANPGSSSANDGSVLQALLESHYSEWMELVERAHMLHSLEQLVGSGNKLTIFAPQNHQMNPEVKSFLLKPPNAHLLKKMIQFHVLPQRVTVSQWRDTSIVSLAGDSVTLSSEKELGGGSNSDDNKNVKLYVGEAEVVAAEIIVRDDGIVHGVDQMLLPMSVQQAYVDFTTRHLAIPLPTGAPGLDTRRIILAGKGEQVTAVAEVLKEKLSVHAPVSSPVTAPSPFLAPAPGPGPSASPWFYESGSFGDIEVTTFVSALTSFGNYGEFAGLLVDMTSIAAEISTLINRGSKLTILAPDDNAWKEAKLTPEQLNSPAEIEKILRFNIITEYQTEESLYSTLRRNGKTTFNTLDYPNQLTAHELDGLVVFEEGQKQAGVYDHDIFSNGRVSVQGVDEVLMPPKDSVKTSKKETQPHTRSVLEMLQLPSRKSINVNEGPRRMVSTAAPVAAITSFMVLLVINLLI